MNKKVMDGHGVMEVQTVGNTAHAVVLAGFALLSWRERHHPPAGKRAKEGYVPNGNGPFFPFSDKGGG